MRLSDLAMAEPDWQMDGDAEIHDISYDSRAVNPGALFVALRGGYVDGHAFISKAVESGANACVVEEWSSTGVPQLLVPNTRAALATLASRFYRYPSADLRVIGVTGTDGKTTTSHIIDHLLRRAARSTGLIGTISVRIGADVVDHESRQTTPESADVQRVLRLMVDGGVSDAIVESTSHGLDLHRLDHVQFAVGTITNITREHLEHHGDIASYWRAKAVLFERVAERAGSAVVNLDDEGARSVLGYCSGCTHVITFSMATKDADLVASKVESGTSASRFVLNAFGTTYPVMLPLLGEFNIANALAALGTALAVGIEPGLAVRALATMPQIPGRMQRVDCGQPFEVIVDYAHTPESLEKVLRLLRRLNPAGHLIAVSGSAGERDTSKRQLQGRVSAKFADVSIFTNEDPRFEDAETIINEIARGAYEAGGQEGQTVRCVVERRDAVRTGIGLARSGDTVLLAGKGHERSIIWNGVKHPWDEAAVARDELTLAGWCA